MRESTTPDGAAWDESVRSTYVAATVPSDGVAVLGPNDLDEFYLLVDRDPHVNVFADYRARTTRLEPRWLGGEVWGRFINNRLVAACHVGANMVPISCTPDDARAFGRVAKRRPRTVSTIVGPRAAVEALWSEVGAEWGTPRDFRWDQPHMVIDSTPLVAPDPHVRRSVRNDLEALYPACVAMYTEELGVSPELGGGRELYRARVTQLISRGWSFARYAEDGSVIFKAEVACSSRTTAQIQGVWVAPAWRGQGIAAAAMATVVEAIRSEIAPTASLYVNGWNTPARSAYERVGFVQNETFSTVMF